LRAVTHLRIQLPLIDPAHYISRFCALLEFGDDTRKVADDAARLVQRFDRDWMRTGRRPSGICGACILLAARMNNFRRSVQEIVQVVKIADSTLKKRLEEFKSTPSGGLTVQDFRTMWLEEEANPPAFEDARDRDRRMKGLGEKGKKRGRSEVVDGENEEENEGVTVESEAATKRTKRDTVLPDISNVTPEGNVASTSRRPFEIEGTLLDEDALGSPDASFHFTDALLDNLPPTTPANEDEEAIAAEVSQYLQSSEDAAISITMPPPVQPPAPTMSTSTSTNGTTDDWTAGIDDEELDMYLLDEVEVQKKTRMWVEFNKEYLEKIAGK
jgi:transcription factor IIIB subunit 2